VILTNIRDTPRRHLGGEQRDRRLSRAFVEFDASIAAADAAAAAATERAVAAISPAALVAAFVAELEAAKASGAFPAMAAVDVRALAGAITVDAKAVSWRKPSGSTDRGGESPGLEIQLPLHKHFMV
jgi:hypothetical protein